MQAIRDGVIDAMLDHDGGALASREVVHVYGTREPSEAFHKRITFCLDVHNEAIRAMRYPPNAHREALESAEKRREREEAEEAFAQELEEDGDFDDDE